MADITVTIREALAALYAETGVLTPEAVVDAATPEDSPLHPHFEWNDGVAGHKFRLVQAREMIRKVRVTVITSPKEPPKHIRVYHSMTPVGGDSDDKLAGARVYRSFEDIRNDPDAMDRLLSQMEREFRALRTKWLAHAEAFHAVVLRVVGEDGEEEHKAG